MTKFFGKKMQKKCIFLFFKVPKTLKQGHLRLIFVFFGLCILKQRTHGRISLR